MIVEIHLANRIVFILPRGASVVQIEVILGCRDVSRHGSAPVHRPLYFLCCCCFCEMRSSWRGTGPRPRIG